MTDGPGLYSDTSDSQEPNERAARAKDAFDVWHKANSDKVSKEDEERMLGIRDAVATGDRERAQKHLSDAKEHSGWLYEELMKHPEVSAIMRELSIMGL